MKKTVKHFVGQVKEQCNDGWSVQFTRPYKEKCTWPKFEDVDIVDENDIIKILPEPTVNRRGSL